jgi:outer membrane protein assembly factor BamB
MADVFISYSSEDQDAAHRLRARLDEDGYSCWMAPDDVRGNRTWAEQILSAIEESKVLLILISGNANSSSHVANEVSIAFDKGKAILPVRVEDVQPAGSLEYLLKLAQWVDAFPGPVDRHMEVLRDSLAALVVEAGGVAGPVERKRRLRDRFGRRGWLIVGVTAGAIVLIALVTLGFEQILGRLNTLTTSPSTGASPAGAPPGASAPALVQSNASAKAGQVRWSLNIGGSVFHAPLMRDGVLYDGGDGQTLLAVDYHTGHELLSVPTGGAVTGIPEVANGMIYYPCDDKSIHAVDQKSGRLIWQFKTDVNVQSPPEWISGPKADDKKHLFAGVADGTLVCLDAMTGKKEWTAKLTQPGTIPQPLVLGGKVFYSSWDSKCGILDAETGARIAVTDLGDSVYGLPQLSDGRIYLRTYEGVVLALDPSTLSLVWRANVGSWNATNQGNGVDYYPVPGDGIVCSPGEDDTMFAFNAATGSIVWKSKAASPVYPAAIGDGVVVFGSEDGTLYCLDDKSGKQLWKYRAGASLGTPAAESGGTAAIADTSGNLCALPVR